MENIHIEKVFSENSPIYKSLILVEIHILIRILYYRKSPLLVPGVGLFFNASSFEMDQRIEETKKN
jgi:hypothetical protein